MTEPRYRPKTPPEEEGGDYFGKAPKYDFIPTGCTLLDCVLGGGWPLGRISNVVGDKAVGKTLLAIEACANFASRWPKGHIWYRESENAFDVDYANALGLPTKRVDFGPDGIDTAWDTMEDIIEDLEACLSRIEKKGKSPGGLYIIDSLDALSSRAELKRKPDEGTFGLEKQKMLGQLFRRHRHRLKKNNVHLMFISQVRDKIGFVIGDKHTRTGGKALDFYASQILWLHHMKTINETMGKIKRPTAVQIKAKCKKNKIGQPFRTCEFQIRFGYGVDDVQANWLFLKEIGKKVSERVTHEELAQITRQAWADIEKSFTPKERKYAQA
jgi:recombination protein RecA